MERALKENEGRRRAVKTLPLAQLELEGDVPMAGWVRKGSKGWIGGTSGTCFQALS